MSRASAALNLLSPFRKAAAAALALRGSGSVFACLCILSAARHDFYQTASVTMNLLATDGN